MSSLIVRAAFNSRGGCLGSDAEARRTYIHTYMYAYSAASRNGIGIKIFNKNVSYRSAAGNCLGPRKIKMSLSAEFHLFYIPPLARAHKRKSLDALRASNARRLTLNESRVLISTAVRIISRDPREELSCLRFADAVARSAVRLLILAQDKPRTCSMNTDDEGPNT